MSPNDPPPRKKPDLNAIYAKFEENPAAFMAAAAGLLIGISKIVDAAGSYQGSRAYKKDADRRVREERRRTARSK